MEEKYLENILNRVGKATFIKYYYEFKNLNELEASDRTVVEKIEENYTLKSKMSRTSKAKRIFREELEINALEIIINSPKVDLCTIEKAKKILLEEQIKIK